MAKQGRTIVVRDVASESDMKGVIVIVICYMYAIFLFITAALCAQIFKGIKSSCEYNLLLFLPKFRIPYKNYNQNDYTRHNSVDSVSHFALDSHEVCRLKETQSKISVGKIRILMLWTYSPLNLDRSVVFSGYFGFLNQ